MTTCARRKYDPSPGSLLQSTATRRRPCAPLCPAEPANAGRLWSASHQHHWRADGQKQAGRLGGEAGSSGPGGPSVSETGLRVSEATGPATASARGPSRRANTPTQHAAGAMFVVTARRNARAKCTNTCLR